MRISDWSSDVCPSDLFNIYDICYARSKQHQQEYIEYIDEAYNAERLTAILTEVARIIGANILIVARQDDEPQGASVTMLISAGHHDDAPTPGKKKEDRKRDVKGESV